MTFKNLECLHKTHFETQCWGQKRPHASSEMDKLTSNTNEEDQIMASVARDLGEDLTAKPLVEFSSGVLCGGFWLWPGRIFSVWQNYIVEILKLPKGQKLKLRHIKRPLL